MASHYVSVKKTLNDVGRKVVIYGVTAETSLIFIDWQIYIA